MAEWTTSEKETAKNDWNIVIIAQNLLKFLIGENKNSNKTIGNLPYNKYEKKKL